MVVFPVDIDVLTTLVIPRPRAELTVVRLERAKVRVTLVPLVVVDTTLTTLTRSNLTDDVFAVPLSTPTSTTAMAVVMTLMERVCWHSDTAPLEPSLTVASSWAVSSGIVVAFKVLMVSG